MPPEAGESAVVFAVGIYDVKIGDHVCPMVVGGTVPDCHERYEFGPDETVPKMSTLVLHVIWALPPFSTELLFEERLMEHMGVRVTPKLHTMTLFPVAQPPPPDEDDVVGCVTVTVREAVAVCPFPVQETLYVVVVVGFTTTEPDVLLPVEKLLPVHAVALLELHESVELLPFEMVVGVAVIDTLGAGPLVVEQSPVVYVIGNPYTYTVVTVHAADATGANERNENVNAPKSRSVRSDGMRCVFICMESF